ncbi:MAG: transglutaminase [Myxococcaceae bacterium]|nr:transglutaminase [Myxococcaceae bacterium]
MQIRSGYEIGVRCERSTPLLGLLSVHPSRTHDLRSPAQVSCDGAERVSTFCDPFGNTCLRMLAPRGLLTLRADFVLEDSGLPDLSADGTLACRVEELPADVVQFLSASRYCETDKLAPLAWSLFGETTPDAARVQAIVRYVHDRIRFGYEHASSTRSAWEAHQERRGVCRDFVHLAVAFCRAMNLPARYCSGYLGDIGVEASDVPMDFTAWMEVYLGDRWYTFDPRHDARRVGRILMARGRDAADVAIYTTFGPSELVSFRVFSAAL